MEWFYSALFAFLIGFPIGIWVGWLRWGRWPRIFGRWQCLG